jgi:hypothetical protein
VGQGTDGLLEAGLGVHATDGDQRTSSGLEHNATAPVRPTDQANELLHRFRFESLLTQLG